MGSEAIMQQHADLCDSKVIRGVELCHADADTDGRHTVHNRQPAKARHPDDTNSGETRIGQGALPTLVACDVDGTLFDDDATITPRTRNSVCGAVAAGIHFILATGRPPRWVSSVVDKLGFAPPAVCANGAVLYDPAADQVLSAHTLSVDTLRELAQIVARFFPGAGLAVERIAGHGDPQFISTPDYVHDWPNPGNTEVSIEEVLSRPAIKMLISQVGATSADMAAKLAGHTEGHVSYATNKGVVEITPPGISKATGVSEIAGSLGVTHDGAAAFGDMPNDVPMLVWAGHGVAMGNSHPEVLAVANEVTASNREDGVAQVLERWLA